VLRAEKPIIFLLQMGEMTLMISYLITGQQDL
jgi:hypothetical protein